MITRHIEYTKEHKEKIRKAYKDFTIPQYLGDDGDLIAVRALSKERALEKMIQAEMGFAEETRKETEEKMKLEDIGYGWVQLVDENRKSHKEMVDEGCDCFVSHEEQSDYPVFVYTI